jgi:hypothetical protein
MTSIEHPQTLTLLFIHRKEKDYIKSVVTKVEGLEKFHYSIYKSKDGFQGELTTDGIFSPEALPQTGNSIFSALLNLAKYIKKSGYKVCNTIVQTKNGVKIR